jgi:hypothetical protein
VHGRGDHDLGDLNMTNKTNKLGTFLYIYINSEFFFQIKIFFEGKYGTFNIYGSGLNVFSIPYFGVCVVLIH